MPRKLSPTYNLAILYPEVASQWHPTKNGDLKPSEVYPDNGGIQCPYCKSYIKTKIQFCKICGAYPI